MVSFLQNTAQFSNMNQSACINCPGFCQHVPSVIIDGVGADMQLFAYFFEESPSASKESTAFSRWDRISFD